jgi:hypothetical protein
VAPERFDGWVRRFRDRHGPVAVSAGDRLVRLGAADGAIAECHVPFPPLTPAADPAAALTEHALRDRLVGVVLVRLGGYAAGIFAGSVLVTSKVGSRLVQGRSAAGGWSQQRFARRREKQASQAHGAAAEVAARVLAPRLAELDAVVFGGDRRAVDALRADRRLAEIFALESEQFLTVPDPRLVVLVDTPKTFRAIRVRVLDPESESGR